MKVVNSLSLSLWEEVMALKTGNHHTVKTKASQDLEIGYTWAACDSTEVALHLPYIFFTHLLPEQFPTSIHILTDLPSKLFLDLLLTLIDEPFNLSLFLFVDFQTSFPCIFISRSQHLLPSTLLSLIRNFHLIIPPHTLCVPIS